MTVQDLSQLRSQPFLRGMPPDQLAELASLSRHVIFPAGERLFEEGGTADTFWIIDAGQVTLDASVPGRGRVTIERLGRNDVVGLSWLTPPYQWRYGAVTASGVQAFAFDARAVRAACAADPVLGAEIYRRFCAAVVHRLQVTRARLLDACSHPDGLSR
ncbi:MAG TPA: cyclic nucleotide-binding domain-containing protein [Streptosporangiaceae bacterium]|nr:cyclic nucleotide-binding domain-containing protein [Streptosporangiaceae bacterium]